MNECLIERWNSKVSQDDIVYVVGDVFLGDPTHATPIVQQLNGKKILILGNHDRSPKTMLASGFIEVHRRLEITLRDGKKALLSHKPLPEMLLKEYDLQIHGHRHTEPAVLGKKINVCVDLWGYEPVHESEICDIILNSELDSSEYHANISHNSLSVSINAKVKREDLDGLIDHLNEYRHKIWK
jgi:calcineurin-like phosphoesterase family protein